MINKLLILKYIYSNYNILTLEFSQIINYVNKNNLTFFKRYDF